MESLARLFARRAVVAPMAALLFLVLVGLPVDWVARAVLESRTRSDVAIQLNHRATAVASTINARLSMVDAIASYVQPHGTTPGHLDRPEEIAQLAAFVTNLYFASPHVRSMTIAPGGIVRYVFPEEGNEQLIGRNLLQPESNPDHEDVARAVRSGRIAISGPYDLVSGEPGLTAWKVVLGSNRRLLAIVGVEINLPTLLWTAGVYFSQDDFRIAFRDQSDRVFFGSPDVFAAAPVATTVNLIDGTWEIAAVPVRGWDETIRPLLRAVQAAVVAIAVAIGLAVYALASRHQNLRAFAFTLRQEVEERRRAEDAERSAKEAAQNANRAKSEFLANMSHELRTPLNAIIGFSEVIEREMFGPLGTSRYREYAHDIRMSGAHLLDIVSDMLDLSKIEAGKFVLKSQQVEIPEVIDEAVGLVRPQAERGELAVEVRCPPDLPHLLGDQRAIRQVLVNLLSNSVKFTPAGGHVLIQAGHVPAGGLWFAVTDTGVGISSGDIPKVLEPFGHVEPLLTKSQGGTGLGLPLAKAFVELHGGSLEIASCPGEGTTVTCRFPPERILPESRDAAAAAAGTE